MAEEVLAYTESVCDDWRLVQEDIWCSKAHSIMLAKQGIIPSKDLKSILKALDKLDKAQISGKFRLDTDLEDVHLNVEDYVMKEAGSEVGGKLHIARSRNDLVLCDTRLWVRRGILECMKMIANLQRELINISRKNEKTLMPGFTHTQHAQPITLAYWATAYAIALNRDLDRLMETYDRINKNPLGACAMAGTSHPIDRHTTKKLLGFDDVDVHALDVSGSRDTLIEVSSNLSLLMLTLSKIASELILWSTPEFGFITLSDEYTTGSSIMPQKKNPDVAELLRAKTARVAGIVGGLAFMASSLPSGYNRDYQEIKSTVFESFDLTVPSVALLGGMLSTMKVNAGRLSAMLESDYSTATELADYLVREKKISFRKAHKIVGETVKELIKKNKFLSDTKEVKKALNSKGVSVDVDTLSRILDPKNAVEAHTSLGGTSSGEVGRMIKKIKDDIIVYNRKIQGRERKIRNASKLTEKIVKQILSGKKITEVRV